MPPERPVRVAIVNDYELVVAGIAAVLAPYVDRVVVVELDSQLPVVQAVDVLLYDSFGQAQGAAIDLESVNASGVETRVVVFSWNIHSVLVEQSLARGASGYVSKGVSATELVDLLERVHAGEQVTPQATHQGEGDDFGRWPGDQQGLSAREAEVLALICQGLSNAEISERAFLGINTIKTYVRTLYAKIGVDSRTRALLWGIDHGFRPDQVRRLPSALHSATTPAGSLP